MSFQVLRRSLRQCLGSGSTFSDQKTRYPVLSSSFPSSSQSLSVSAGNCKNSYGLSDRVYVDVCIFLLGRQRNRPPLAGSHYDHRDELQQHDGQCCLVSIPYNCGAYIALTKNQLSRGDTSHRPNRLPPYHKRYIECENCEH